MAPRARVARRSRAHPRPPRGAARRAPRRARDRGGCLVAQHPRRRRHGAVRGRGVRPPRRRRVRPRRAARAGLPRRGPARAAGAHRAALQRPVGGARARRPDLRGAVLALWHRGAPPPTSRGPWGARAGASRGCSSAAPWASPSAAAARWASRTSGSFARSARRASRSTTLAGSSFGAMVAGVYAAGGLDALEELIAQRRRLQVHT